MLIHIFMIVSSIKYYSEFYTSDILCIFTYSIRSMHFCTFKFPPPQKYI